LSALAWTAATAGALAAFVVAVELGARAWLARHGRYFVWAPGSRMRLEIDRTTLPTLEQVAEHSINADGERGDEVPPDAGTFRVLVVGGSAAECYYLDQRTQWPSVLQQALARPENLARLGARRVHVGNIARSLVTCRHVDRILEKTLPRYGKLDAIVFMVGASDVVTWMEHGTPARIEDGPIPPGQLFAQHPEGPFGWTPRKAAVRRIASAAKRRLLRRVDVRERAGKRLAEVRAMRAAATTLVRTPPDARPMLDHFERWFERCLERARAKAPLVLVVRQPWLEKRFTPEEERWLWSYAVGRPYHQKCTTYFAHEAAWELLRAVDRRAEAVATRMGVAQVDLMPLLPADFATWYDEQHHTPAGCRLVGEAAARALVEAARPKPAVAAPRA
jgi:lysophospholipase L1-like esterase